MTMKSEIHFQRNMMTVTALNNIGVSLLKQQCYDEALRVFQDALVVMVGQIATIDYTPDKECHFEVFHDSSSTNTILKKASRKLVHANIDKTTADSTFDFDVLKLEILSLDQYPDMIFINAAKSSPSSETSYAIRIDDFEIYDDENASCHLYEVYAAVLLNIGTACRFICSSCIHQNKKHKKKMSRMYSTGVKCCKESYAILSDLIGEADNIESSRQTLLALLVLQSLMHLSFEMGEKEQAREYYKVIGDIQADLAAEESTDYLSSFCAAVAARAA